MKTEVERIAALETEVRIMKEELSEMNRKLDDLLALRYKGAGIFWLASALFGTSIVGAVTMFLQWVRG